VSDMATVLKARSFSVDEYHRMADAGLFEAGPHVELLDGLIVEMPPIGKAHWVSHGRIFRYLVKALDGYADVEGQISLPLGKRSEPQPDLAVLALSAVEDRIRPVAPAEILAMIEIAETSLAKDSGPKRLLYARFGIPNYLVVDLAGEVLLNYNAPSDGDYGVVQTLPKGDVFALIGVPAVSLEASAFLP
jgi:Uma2 family endonuclease